MALSEMFFNMDSGYFEGLLRGFRAGILKHTDYINLCQCENLDDLKIHLATTAYGNFLQNEASPLAVSTIDDKLKERLVHEFNHIRSQCVEPLATFLDFITYSYMIDNVILLITGTLHDRDIHELVSKCHPLGLFPAMATLSIASTPAELYSTVLVDTPLAPFFMSCITEQDMNEMNIEIIRNTLYKEYLESFYHYCQSIGGATAEVMGGILEFEADRRAFNITINSFGTELTRDVRAKLFPTIGKLHPEGLAKLADANDFQEVQRVAEFYPVYRALFDGIGTGAGEKTLEDKFFEHEIHQLALGFQQQFHYGVFFAYFKIFEQQNRNIIWISECIQQRQKQRIDRYTPIPL